MTSHLHGVAKPVVLEGMQAEYMLTCYPVPVLHHLGVEYDLPVI